MNSLTNINQSQGPIRPLRRIKNVVMLKRAYLWMLIPVLAMACESTELDRKKEELKKLKVEAQSIKEQIKELEQEIATLDPDFAKTVRRSALVTTQPVQYGKFEHFVEVRGDVSSRRNIQISPETNGMIQRVYVKEGVRVKKGQLIAKLDDEDLRNNIQEVKTQLELASNTFERQSRLWDKNIGTEVQYLESKNRKEGLENNLATLESQLRKTEVRAPFEGAIDRVMAREGEMAQPGMPIARLVGTENVYISADISEAYIGTFGPGDEANIRFPSLEKNFIGKVFSVGQVINEQNRTFTVEIQLDISDVMIRPNMLAIVKLKDFEADEAISVPTNLIQRDNRGDYIYVVAEEEGMQVARKKYVVTGKTYKSSTMIKEGLEQSDQLIEEGFREVADGTKLNIVKA